MVVEMVNNRSEHCLVGQRKAERLIGIKIRHCSTSAAAIQWSEVEMRRPVSKSDEGIDRAG